MSLADIRRAIADELAKIESARAAVVEARESLARAETAERETVVRSELRIAALEGAARMYEEEQHAERDLHTRRGNATNKHMPVVAQKHAPAPKRMGRPFASDHPLALWIAVHGTAEELAKKLAAKAKEPCSASRVRSWYLEPPHGRPCPEVFQAILEEPPYNIPRRAWKNRPSK